MTDINRFGGKKLQSPVPKLKLVRIRSWSMSKELLILQDTINHVNTHVT